MLEFKLLFPAKIHIINKHGDIGIVTLWSRPELMIKWLNENNISQHRIAVIANLYGNGLPVMLRNLLYNPQINYLLILGQNLSGSKEELINFFDYGIEETEYLGTKAHRIIGTNRIIDDMVQPCDFNLQVFSFGNLSEISTEFKLERFFYELPLQKECTLERKEISMPEIEIQRYPSNPRGHDIFQETPLEAYKELIFHLTRFGYHNKLKKGVRIELQNTKVVISNPIFESTEELENHGFSLELLQKYQKDILDFDLHDSIYTYGNRLRCYFQVDGVQKVIEILKKDINSRHAYISLWDTGNDLDSTQSVPCLVSVYFRCFDGKLTLTATFRTHNALSAWLVNVYGLMSLLNLVSSTLKVHSGSITVFSHSIGIDAMMLEKAKMIAGSGRNQQMQIDPNGNFTITVDKDTNEIVVEHQYDGVKISEYRGTTPMMLEKQLYRNGAISNIGHALYVGREIQKAFEILNRRTS